jgi:polyisoprenoid-binding protein YceI
MSGPLAPPGSWRVDPTRSTVGWSVKHLGVQTVAGSFTAFAGELSGDRASGTVAAESVRTDDEQRDRFVRSNEFLDADAFPELQFEATVVDGEPTELDGELTIAGKTLPVTLTAEQVSSSDSAVELRLRGTVKRRAYGLRFTQAMGAADRSVSDEVHLALDLVLVPAG